MMIDPRTGALDLKGLVREVATLALTRFDMMHSTNVRQTLVTKMSAVTVHHSSSCLSAI